MAKRKAEGEGEGEETPFGAESMAALEEKKEQEQKAAEDMEQQQKDAAAAAAAHATQLRKRGETGRPTEIMTVSGTMISTEPTDLDEYEGEYKNVDDGEIYGLKLVPDDGYGHTHQLKNTDHFWSGTADDFKKKFERQ